MIEIDGSRGEGGGQVLRTSLGLSLVTGRPFRIRGIRARRPKPGLRAQHLAAVRAAATVGSARLEGAELGSRELVFEPWAVTPGRYDFDVGTAGSSTLVLLTVLPALCLAGGPSTVVLRGGTHNPLAPPFDHLERVHLPLLERMGPRVRVVLERHGFYPAGGGRMTATIQPVSGLSPLDLRTRGPELSRRARALIARLPRHVGARELEVVAQALGWEPRVLEVEEVESDGPGNALLLEVAFDHGTTLVAGFGERGVRAEVVAARAAAAMRRYLDSGAPVDEHLADQLLVAMALAGSGSFESTEPTSHTRTNAAVIQEFVDVRFELTPASRARWRIEVCAR